jgi:ABC-type multidrug transport system ATPase subunit/ABC-type multidrug transport system permease subunit
VIENGRARLEDLGSSNGTFINSRERRIESAFLAETDTVFLGSFRVPAARILGPIDGRPCGGSFLVAFRGSELVLGRGRECDRLLSFPMVSRRHARLSRMGNAMRIEDLGSSNGTYVNGVRVREPTVVRPGDQIGLGSYTFTLTVSGDLEERDSRDDLTLEARDISVEAPGRTLIEGISLLVRPGELVGLMGPGGAGKSTLLKALGGHLGVSRGAVLLNGVDLARHPMEFRAQIGFVPQDDIVHRELTVAEALWFAARLRLPADYHDAEIRQRVRDVLEQLELTACADMRIGASGGSGCSASERSRINLAVELLTDPPVLLVDDPTSGVSPEDALSVMRLLKKLAQRGKSVLVSIHRADSDLFRKLDRVAVLARDAGGVGPGRLAYDGPAYPDAILYFNSPQPVNLRPDLEREPSPDDLLKGLAQRPAKDWADRLAIVRSLRAEASMGSVQPSIAGELAPVAQELRPSALGQWWALVQRNVAIKRQDRWNMAILVGQAPVIAVLIVIVFGRPRGTGVEQDDWVATARAVVSTTFAVGMAALWFGCSNAIREIVAEWPIYQRERMFNLKLVPYVASKLAALGVLCLIQCAILLAIVHLGTGLKGPWLATMAMLVLTSSVGMALGLVISALARTPRVAIALLPLLMLPMLIFGGGLQPVHKMHPSLRIVCNVFPSRWAFEGLVVLESDQRPFAPTAAAADPAQPADDFAVAPRDMAEHYFPAETARRGPTAAAIALAGTFLFLTAFVGVVLKFRDPV